MGDTPWVHVDIAGPSMANKAYNVYAKGGTGHGVLTFLKLIEDYAPRADHDGATTGSAREPPHGARSAGSSRRRWRAPSPTSR